MSPCNFFLFPFLKKHLRGCRFGNLIELQTEIKNIFKHITPEMFEEAFKSWAYRWKKCVISLGAYFEGKGVEVDNVSIAADDSSTDSSTNSEATDDSDTDPDQ